MRLKKSKLIANKTIEISGSKSISNRLLILEKIFENIRIENLSDSQDTQLLQKALDENSEVVDVHHAGTAMRFLTAFFCIQEGKTTVITGSERMKQRPIKPLVDALKTLGAEIEYLENEGFPPLKIVGKKIQKSKIAVAANISSQFITALLLIGGKLQNGLEIDLEGKITSLPYLEMTIKILKEIGIEVLFEGSNIKVFQEKKNIEKRLVYFNVESDWSSASYFYSFCAIGKKTINLQSFKNFSLQGDSRIKEIYWKNFGVNTISDTAHNEVSLTFPDLIFNYPKKIELDLNDFPDIAQTICVTAATLKIPFQINGLETLKFKETDRLVALKNELNKIGCETEITENAIKSIQFFEPPKKIAIKTYNDHRMAMSFAPFCLIREINIENPEVVEKSYPNFWKDIENLVYTEEI